MPRGSTIIAAKGAFLAKSPKISVMPSSMHDGFDSMRITDDTEILYLSPSSTGSLIAFDMMLHEKV